MAASIGRSLSASLFIACAWTACGSNPKEYGSGVNLRGPSKADIDQSLAVELHAKGRQKERVEGFKQALAPSYAALPKNQDGNLAHQTARYILHRLFVERHGWYIKGLEPSGDAFHTKSDEDSFKDWAPSYLVDHMEEQVGHRGLDLNDLATLGAALEDLVQQEATASMARIYDVLSSFKEGPADHEHRIQRVQDATKAYLASFLSGELYDAADAVKKREVFFQQYPDRERTEIWYKKLENRFMNETSEPGYEVANHIALAVGAEYSAFNDGQCSDLKSALVNRWGKGKEIGRVRLSDFYSLGLESERWAFTEKRDYLRALGALDDSNASSPMVIIPNYMSSQSNCLSATNLYSACCKNECEDILGHLERKLLASSASPARIAELVSSLGSDTVPAPRELDRKLVERLESIAETHDHRGEVKLHGRLFSQWLHHAYPNECPYPHEAGTSDPSSPNEWLGADVAASDEERQQYVDAETCSSDCAEAMEVDIPWSHSEELLSHHTPDATLNSAISGFWKVLLVLATIAGIAAALGANEATARKFVLELTPQHLLLAVLTLILVITNMVNWVLLAVMVSVGLLLHRGLAASAQHVGKNDKLAEDKCYV